jgi:hypothetical protein
MIMKAQPLRKARTPKYPTRLEILARPVLLERHQPTAWRAVPEMTGAVAFFLAANLAGQAAEKKAAGQVSAVAVVAPIFEHGEGRGATGCVMVAPPNFLSEEEAWQVIGEELSKKGLDLSEKEFEIQGVKIAPSTRGLAGVSGAAGNSGPDTPLKADRADPKRRVAVEFVSQKDYHRLGGGYSMSTVQSYDFKGVAKSVGEQVRKDATDKVHFGVLYDPASRVDPVSLNTGQNKTPEDWVKAWQAAGSRGRAESQRLLRLQVQDFIKWLEAQGAI